MRHAAGTVIACLILFCIPHRASSQWSTYDAKQDFNATFANTQHVAALANQALELKTLGSFALNNAYMSEVNTLISVTQEASGLMTDLQSLQRQLASLFGTTPTSTSAMTQRLQEIRRLRYQAYSYVVRVQLLTRTMQRVLGRIQRLVAGINGLSGNMAANQTIVQMQASTQQMLAKMQLQASAWQQANAIKEMEEPLTQDAIRAINAETMRDYPQ
jgi:hypothetical protein